MTAVSNASTPIPPGDRDVVCGHGLRSLGRLAPKIARSFATFPIASRKIAFRDTLRIIARNVEGKIMIKFPLIVASTVLAVLAVVVPAHADPTIYPPSYGSSGVYAVGGHTVEGLTASIPPGHYRVDQAPGWPFRAPGFWLRCSAVPCDATHPEHIVASGDQPESTLMEIPPTDTAVRLFNVTLTFLG